MFGWEFPPHSSGGLGTACAGLTKGLTTEGVAITFVLPRRVKVAADYLQFVFGDSNKHYIVNSLLKAYSTEMSYREEWSLAPEQQQAVYGGNLFAEVARYEDIAREIAEQEEFDVIHAHDWLTFKAGVAAKRSSHKKLVVHVHATEFDRTGGSGVNQAVYDIERQGMQEADLVITVSNFTKNNVIRYYGIPEEKIRVVHNGVETENYTLEKAHKLGKNNNLVLFLGRLTLQKGPDYFLAAAKRVLQKAPNTIFMIVGSGDMEQKLIERSAEWGIADKVLFAGFLRGDDINKAYQMADVYVMPSVSEPFGITPLESIKNNTPAIISKQSGVSETLTHCLKVDFWDVDELANKILAVIKYPELKKTLQTHGKKEVEGITWGKSAQKTKKVYEELMGGQD